MLPKLISTQQTAYVEGRSIAESGRLIANILEISGTLQTKGILVTIDIQKAFDSINHSFLSSVLEKFDFGTNFIDWIKIILKSKESCIINGGMTISFRKGYSLGWPNLTIFIYPSAWNAVYLY